MLSQLVSLCQRITSCMYSPLGISEVGNDREIGVLGHIAGDRSRHGASWSEEQSRSGSATCKCRECCCCC